MPNYGAWGNKKLQWNHLLVKPLVSVEQTHPESHRVCHSAPGWTHHRNDCNIPLTANDINTISLYQYNDPSAIFKKENPQRSKIISYCV